MATFGSIVLLLPLAYFSFSVLSRSAAKQLTGWYFGLNLLLLLPVRDPSAILAISLVVLIVLSRFLFKKGVSNTELSSWKTLEGKFARIILFVPLIVFPLRSMFCSTFNILLSSVMILVLPVLYGHEFIAVIFYPGWLGLAISGITIIVLASVLDRYGAVLKLKISQKRKEFI